MQSMIVSCGYSAMVTLLVRSMPNLPNTYYPLNAFSQKQTTVTKSALQNLKLAANQGIRAQGLPSLSL